MHFSETNEKLQQELDDIRRKVEETRLIKSKEMSEQESEREHDDKMDSVSEDFKSLQPFFIKSNAEEHMARISTLKEMKLQALKEQLESSEKNLQRTVNANKKEIQTIIEETIETKSFMEWIEEKNYFTLKELEVKQKNEWDEFSREMETSRNLSKAYAEKHAIYLEIKRQEDQEEHLSKQNAAATILQAHWRGNMTRRRLRGDVVF